MGLNDFEVTLIQNVKIFLFAQASLGSFSAAGTYLLCQCSTLLSQVEDTVRVIQPHIFESVKDVKDKDVKELEEELNVQDSRQVTASEWKVSLLRPFLTIINFVSCWADMGCYASGGRVIAPMMSGSHPDIITQRTLG